MKPSVRRRADGADRSIDPAGLAALVDLGMTDVQIGSYFALRPEIVRALRGRYGIGRNDGAVRGELRVPDQ